MDLIMRSAIPVCFSTWVCLAAWASPGLARSVTEEAPAEAAPSGEQRRTAFRYAGAIRDLPPNSRVRVWLPVASDSNHQTIDSLDWDIAADSGLGKESRYGNWMLYFELQPAEQMDFPFEVNYVVTRRELRSLDQPRPAELSNRSRARFLKPNRLVPIAGAPVELLEGMELPEEPLDLGRALYNRVEQHMTYGKSQPGYGQGDVAWACESRTGNCTDFHSLFISLARSQGLPARFEIGFPLPADKTTGKVGGYHCWCSFFVPRYGWVPVDISEADKHPEMKPYYFGNLTPHRITFSTGRDLELEPAQQGPPLNYFVYPYVEVDGQSWPAEKIDLKFEFSDQPDEETGSGEEDYSLGSSD